MIIYDTIIVLLMLSVQRCAQRGSSCFLIFRQSLAVYTFMLFKKKSRFFG